MPSCDMYQSLHTTMIGPGGEPVEIQIRARADPPAPIRASPRAGSTRTTGPARTGPGGRRDGDIGWLPVPRGLAAGTSADPGEFLDALASRSMPEVFALHSQGRGHPTLPASSTPVNWPMPCTRRSATGSIGARVTARFVARRRKLDHGDSVEIFTFPRPKAPGPAAGGWLHQERARLRRGRAVTSADAASSSIDRGKDLLTKAMHKPTFRCSA